jgi:4-hydroxy-tetrahydrodipicolinate reductase
MSNVRVLLAGAGGKVGRELCRSLPRAEGVELVGVISRSLTSQSLAALTGSRAPEVPVYHDIQAALEAGVAADVLVDFTVAEAARETLPRAIAAGIAPVVGTTGFATHELAAFAQACAARGIGGAFVANFAVGVMLMMRFAEEARRFFPDVEIVELHHKTKLDAPSGTALRTRERLMQAQGDLPGGEVPIHSVRLPGLVAHQEVMFGGLGQVLTIRHDATSREAYVPGVVLACRWVVKRKRVAFDLEEIAFG